MRFARTAGTAVHEHASVHALSGDERLLVRLVADRVTEVHAGQGGAPSGVMDQRLHDTLDVTTLLAVINGTEVGGSLPQAPTGRENRTGTLTRA